MQPLHHNKSGVIHYRDVDGNWNPRDLIFAHHHGIWGPTRKEAPPFSILAHVCAGTSLRLSRPLITAIS
jgi:hypothetical protein